MNSKEKRTLGVKKTTPTRQRILKKTEELRMRTIFDFWKRENDEAEEHMRKVGTTMIDDNDSTLSTTADKVAHDDQKMTMNLSTPGDNYDDDEECVFNMRRICEKPGCEAKTVKLSILKKRHVKSDDMKDFEYKRVTQTKLI